MYVHISIYTYIHTYIHIWIYLHGCTYNIYFFWFWMALNGGTSHCYMTVACTSLQGHGKGTVHSEAGTIRPCTSAGQTSSDNFGCCGQFRPKTTDGPCLEKILKKLAKIDSWASQRHRRPKPERRACSTIHLNHQIQRAPHSVSERSSITTVVVHT